MGSHSKDYPGWTREQYAERAHTLACCAVGGNVLGYKATNGYNADSIVRYDWINNDWVRAFYNGVSTMYKPADGEMYYERTKAIDTGELPVPDVCICPVCEKIIDVEEMNICVNCGWEDDILQTLDPTYCDGANPDCLNDWKVWWNEVSGNHKPIAH